MKNKDTLRKIQYHGYNFRLRSQKKKKKDNPSSRLPSRRMPWRILMNASR